MGPLRALFYFRKTKLEEAFDHDPEKWVTGFPKDHAQTIS
jgi:hypothetical protein